MTDQKPAKKPTFQVRPASASFVTISRSALLDARLSYAAKGVLATSMAYPQSVIFDTNSIIANSTDEKSVVIAALKELRLLGYLVSGSESDTGSQYQFCDVPVQEQQEAEEPVAAQSIAQPVVTQPMIDLPAFDRHQKLQEAQASPPAVVQGARGRPRSAKPHQGVELPDWMEPYQKEMESWQANRARKHPKLPKGITKTSLSGLAYARNAGVLREFCEHAAESCWQSLGFAGYREYIDKLVGDKVGKNARTNQAIAPINYTLG